MTDYPTPPLHSLHTASPQYCIKNLRIQSVDNRAWINTDGFNCSLLPGPRSLAGKTPESISPDDSRNAAHCIATRSTSTRRHTAEHCTTHATARGTHEEPQYMQIFVGFIRSIHDDFLFGLLRTSNLVSRPKLLHPSQDQDSFIKTTLPLQSLVLVQAYITRPYSK